MRTTIYTALYHSLSAPSVSSDADGRWRGPDNAVHKADFTMHSTFSLWDTFRAEHPLLTLVQPEATNADFVKALVARQKVSTVDILTVCQLQGRETWERRGANEVRAIAQPVIRKRGQHGERGEHQ